MEPRDHPLSEGAEADRRGPSSGSSTEAPLAALLRDGTINREERPIAQRKVYHVTPATESGWQVKGAGTQRASSTHDTKDEAVARARELAKARDPGQVIVHKQDGTIQTEYTYSDDPHPPDG